MVKVSSSAEIPLFCVSVDIHHSQWHKLCVPGPTSPFRRRHDSPPNFLCRTCPHAHAARASDSIIERIAKSQDFSVVLSFSERDVEASLEGRMAALTALYISAICGFDPLN